MPSNLDRLKADIEQLEKQANELYLSLVFETSSDEQLKTFVPEKDVKKLAEESRGKFLSGFQSWYSEASSLVRQLLPDRYQEFVRYYLADPKRKATTSETYRIQDWICGVFATEDYAGRKSFNDTAIVLSAFRAQRDIVSSCKRRFESTLMDIRQVLQADLFDSEIDSARELHKKGFHRAAGSLCGVVLERHLAQVAAAKRITISKKFPTIADLNDPLKNGGAYDMPVWRQIQRLADIRNLCSHSKDREPTNDEITELIDGTSKITKTVN